MQWHAIAACGALALTCILRPAPVPRLVLGLRRGSVCAVEVRGCRVGRRWRGSTAVRSARSTAIDEAAPTEATSGMPATIDFWTISKPSRPETISTVSESGRSRLLERPADELVDRIVAADVFARGEERAGGVEERRAVEPAGLGEDRLHRAQALGERLEHGAPDAQPRDHRRGLDREVGDRALAADAAARRGVEAARGRRGAGGELDGDDVPAVAVEERLRVSRGRGSPPRRARSPRCRGSRRRALRRSPGCA